jgi:hypothetical protein
METRDDEILVRVLVDGKVADERVITVPKPVQPWPARGYISGFCLGVAFMATGILSLL